MGQKVIGVCSMIALFSCKNVLQQIFQSAKDEKKELNQILRKGEEKLNVT